MSTQDTRYTQDHEWLRLEADGSVVVGITDHAQQQLGDIVFVQAPGADSSFAEGDELAVIESVKAAGEIRAPLAGTVLEVNAALADAPNTVNEDPMGAGWIVKIKPENTAALEQLMDEAAYAQFVESQG